MRRCFSGLLLSLVSLAFSQTALLCAEETEAKALKKTYGITEQEIAAYLEAMRQEDPTIYAYLQELKKKSSEQFEKAAISGIVTRRARRVLPVNSNPTAGQDLLKAQDTLKNMYNISESDIASLWDGLSRTKPNLYHNLMELKKKDPAQLQSLAVQEIIWRRSGQLTAGASSPLEQYELRDNIRQATNNYKSAKTTAEKEAIKQKLRRLVAKSFEDYVKSIDTQINAFKSSIDSLEKTKQEYLNNREEKIEERINFYLTMPAY
jgi:hypothetical protein